MLKLKEISKSYKTGDFVQQALKKINLEFRENEFVAILGTSGSGKTTLLNIIGGLDRYDDGDLIINGKSTKDFKNRDWDAYRNNSVGFIFQSYNLISHISVLSNVKPEFTCKITNSFFKKATDEACHYQLQALPLIDALFAETNPIPVKAAINMIGFNFGIPRLPLVECSDELKGTLHNRKNML